MATPVAGILIVDDHPASLELLAAALRPTGVTIHATTDPEEALRLLHLHRPRIVLTDLVMPKLSGIDLLEQIIAFDPTIDVVLMTAYYTTETAVEAIKKGAADYLNKPVSLKALRERVQRLLADLQRAPAAGEAFHGLVGRGARMAELFTRLQRIAPHYRTMLISGATGTGKDLVARALHDLSPAAQGQYVVLNCSAVVETLFESELFGHVRGAFTGATADKVGLFEHAHGGTLFLDEIGDMPLATQAKLLRVLQNQEVLRVGSLTPRKVNVRVIAATNIDLREAVAGGRFREDLFYRLTMFELRVPSLSERPEDLLPLAQHFLQKFAKEYGKAITGFTPRARLAIAAHSWPGNVRELENAIGHACIMSTTSLVDAPDLPPHTLAQPISATEAPADHPLDRQERLLLEQALAAANGNQSRAAQSLNIGRDALRYKMKKHGLL
ncbi:MAG: sigma-54 dependent transcriptional regulator [Bryobacteraceae bacterium]|nr:sigma-54 dependent transcriptional regulator [Bryobacteraceae bacterium]